MTVAARESQAPSVAQRAPLRALRADPWPARPARPARPHLLQGMRDAQLDRLARLLRRRRIWAVNVGENFGTTQAVSAAAG